jgi:tRNA/tmRNA/rRNA uracil-C5-methylase (TrmA/RlmC/RlmD family)
MISTVYIAKNVYGGDGLGRLGDGRVVFVPGAWAGENVRAEIVEERRGYVKARLVEVVEPSPERIDGGAVAQIPGCVYAGLSYKGECAAKESQLVEFLERARLDHGSLRSPAADESRMLNYRNKVVYHFARRGDGWVIGYRREPGHDIVEIENDPLAVPQINAKLPEIRKSVLALLTTGPMSVRRDVERKGDVTIRWSEKTGVKWWVGEAPEGVVIRETTCGKTFDVPAGGFYQVNPGVGDELVRAVAGEYAKIRKEVPRLIDLYCGVGVFGICCEPGKLLGIESGRKAVEFAKRNAEALRADSSFIAGRVADRLGKVKCAGDFAVVIDPPRGGMEPGMARRLAAFGARKIYCVSCDPATMTRDLKELCRNYRIESVRWFNMFPRTARFETLVVLDRIAPAGERK